MVNPEYKTSFQFRGFQILESHIQKKEGTKSGSEMSVDFTPRGEIHKDKKTYKLLLGVRVHDKEENFSASIEAIGNFSFAENISEDLLSNFFFINAPAILFPYIRAYISTLSNLAGIDTITLPTLNLTALAEALKKHTKEV